MREACLKKGRFEKMRYCLSLSLSKHTIKTWLQNINEEVWESQMTVLVI